MWMAWKTPSSSLWHRVEGIIKSLFMCFLLFYHLQTRAHNADTHTHSPRRITKLYEAARGSRLIEKVQTLTARTCFFPSFLLLDPFTPTVVYVIYMPLPQ